MYFVISRAFRQVKVPVRECHRLPQFIPSLMIPGGTFTLLDVYMFASASSRVGLGGRVGGREASSHIFLFIFLSALSHPLGALIAHSWHSFWPRPAVRDLFSRHPSRPAPCSNNITPGLTPSAL